MIYYKNNGKLNRFCVVEDSEPWNPRKEVDGNIGTMILYWNRYNIGDVPFSHGSEITDYVADMVREKVSTKEIIAYADKKEYNRMLVGDEDEIAEDLIDTMSCEDYVNILTEHDMVFLLVYGYEHGGLTISCSNGYPYSDRWDGGLAGLVFTDKETVMKNCGGMYEKDVFIPLTENNWREVAVSNLQNEVEIYDMYFQNECYGYIVEELEDEEWNHKFSCFGFYYDKYGQELEEKIFRDVFGNIPFEHVIEEVA